MECRELTELGLSGLVGEASPADRLALASHVEVCDRCSAELASLEEMWETLGADPDARVTPSSEP